MQKLHTQKLAIIGTVGLPAKYGGFETLAQQLVLQLDKQFEITVYCSGKTYTKENRPGEWQGARLRYLPLNANGVQSILYDFLSMLHAIIFCDVLLVLGVSGCLFLPFIKMFSKKRVIVNVDGLEWRRPKWSAWARKFLQWSEWMATRYADEIVCDNAAIQKYVLDRYGRYSRLITYGADHVRPVHLTAERAARYSFLNAPYAFKVCRIEPENMIDMVLEAFAQSPTLPLVLVGNWDHSAYGKELRSKYNNYDHLHLLDPIYEPETLNLLRSNCQVYVHGHSAGGTNPSLVEAMYLGLPVLAYDVIYNRITTEHSAAFFDSAATLSAVVQEISVDRLTEIGTRMEQIARRAYNWQLISEMYAEAAWGEHSTPVPSFDFELPLALRQTFEPALKTN